jgi:Mrp family chromosome partitioning ATPase
MSRVADALRLANLEVADASIEQGHPWGRDLISETETGWSRPATSSGGSRDTRLEHQESATGTGAVRSAEASREPEIMAAISPLDGVDPAVRQQIAGVVERVFLPVGAAAPRLVVFAGIDADAHAEWVAAAVADMLAQRTPATIAVVDMNFANPRLHECFGIRPAPRLVDDVDIDPPVVRRVRQVRANLSLVPSGEAPVVAEINADLRARISGLTAAYDHVIICMDPLTGWCGGGLPTISDGVVLVIAADASRRQAGRKIAERLQGSGAAILGAVLTNRRYPIPEALYKRL